MIALFTVLFLFYRMGINLNGMSTLTFLLASMIAFLSTIFVSEVSYYYFESVFLRIKEKFASFRKE
jgi:peptidoglycan/LPS O-acetylase OafA/YrhL